MRYNNFYYTEEKEEEINYYVNEKFAKNFIQKSMSQTTTICSICGYSPCRCSLYISTINTRNEAYCQYCGYLLQSTGSCSCGYYNNKFRPNIGEPCGCVPKQHYNPYCDSYHKCMPYNYNNRPRPNIGEPCGCMSKSYEMYSCNDYYNQYISYDNRTCNYINKPRPNIGEPCGCVSKSNPAELFSQCFYCDCKLY